MAMSMDQAIREFATMVGMIPNRGGYLEVERRTQVCPPIRANNLRETSAFMKLPLSLW